MSKLGVVGEFVKDDISVCAGSVNSCQLLHLQATELKIKYVD